MATEIPFRRDFAFRYGEPESLSPLIRRVVARNASPFTFKGTGTYLVGRGKVAIVDPGPAMDDHIAAVRRVSESMALVRVNHQLRGDMQIA